MLPSLQLALNTLTGKRGRTALLIAAVTIASSLVVAVGCTIASVQASMETSLTRFLGSADARIVHTGSGRFDASLAETVATWDGVLSVEKRLSGSVTLVHPDRRRHPDTGSLLRLTPQATGLDFLFTPDNAPWKLLDGRQPEAPDEILIDPLTEKELVVGIGDTLQVDRFGDPITLKVVGIYARQKMHMLQRPRVYMYRSTLAEASDLGESINLVLIDLGDEVNVDAFCAENAGAVDPPLSLEPAEMAQSGFNERLNANRLGLIVSSVMTFMSAAFIIVTGLTTSVTERQRELAVLRCIGGARRQLFAAQMMVGLSFGVIGAALGVPLGLGLSWLLAAWFKSYLADGLAIESLGIILAIIGSISSGLIGALYPALMSSRIAPLEAMTSSGRPASRRGVIAFTLVALALIALQIVLTVAGTEEFQFWSYFSIGLPALLIGYFMMATPFLLVLTQTVGRAIAWLLRLPPDMLIGSVRQTPYRHGFTAGALMVGLTILASQWTQTKSLMDGWVAPIQFADGFAYRANGITPEQHEAIAELPCVRESCPIGLLPMRLIDEQVFGIEGIAPRSVNCIGFDPDVFFSMNHIEWIEGDPTTGIERLKSDDTILVAERFLTASDIGVGDSIMLGTATVQRSFEIVGVVNSAGLEIATSLFGIKSQYAEHALSCVFMDFETVHRYFDNHDTYLVQVNLTDDVTDEEATEQILNAAPGVQFMSARWIVDTIDEIALAAYTVQSTIAFAALLLASVGVGNVLLAGIIARRYEFGLLRAVGAQKSMVTRLILGEAALLALAGALTGTLVGLHMAIVGLKLHHDLAGIVLPLLIPWIPIAIGWVVMMMMAMASAVPGVISLHRHHPGSMLAGGRI